MIVHNVAQNTAQTAQSMQYCFSNPPLYHADTITAQDCLDSRSRRLNIQIQECVDRHVVTRTELVVILNTLPVV